MTIRQWSEGTEYIRTFSLLRMTFDDPNRFFGRFGTLEWHKRDKECELQIGKRPLA